MVGKQQKESGAKEDVKMSIVDNRVLSTKPDNFNGSTVLGPTVLGLRESRDWHEGLFKSPEKKTGKFENSIFKADSKPIGLIARERKLQQDKQIHIAE